MSPCSSSTEDLISNPLGDDATELCGTKDGSDPDEEDSGSVPIITQPDSPEPETEPESNSDA